MPKEVQSVSGSSTSIPIQPLAVEYFSITIIISKKGTTAKIDITPQNTSPPIKRRMPAAAKKDKPIIAIMRPVTTYGEIGGFNI